MTRQHLILDIIAACGGLAATARRLGVRRQAVWQWKEAGVVPARSAMHLAAVAASVGIVTSAEELAGVAPVVSPPSPPADRRRPPLQPVRRTHGTTSSATKLEARPSPRVYGTIRPRREDRNNCPLLMLAA